MDSWLPALILALTTLEEAQPTLPAQDVIPRISFPYSGPSRTFVKFAKKGYWNYSTLLLIENEEKLYVGARDILFSVDTSPAGNMELVKELHWKATDQKVRQCSFKGKSLERDCFNLIRVLVSVNESHVYACGTYAFSPSCVYIDVPNFSLLSDSNGDPVTEDGKGRCPFDPSQKYTATMVDPTFVGSTFVPESEGDKIYFFFTETRHKSDLLQRMSLSLVARVCKDDVGGERVLQKRWTTFLKAQLLCYLPEDQFPFNVLQDMFVSENEEGSVFYGVFTSQWFHGVSDSTAVCAFTLDDIQKAFNGRYRQLNRDTLTWSLHPAENLEPRPGACSTKPSMDLTLNRVKDLFMMDQAVQPVGRRPQLVNLKEQYVKIAVDTVRSLNAVRHRVMFLITAGGFLHKALNVDGAPHIIEEIQLFPAPQTVHRLVLSSGKGLLYLGSSIGVLQVPVSNCSAYPSCGECILSRDPYCAWDRRNGACKETRSPEDTHGWLQDIENVDAAVICSPPARPRMHRPREIPQVPAIVKLVCSDSLVTLTCRANSNLAQRSWKHEGQNASMLDVTSLPTGLTFLATRQHQGRWECWATENNFRTLLVSYSLQVSGANASPPEAGQQPRADGSPQTYRSQLLLVSVLFGLFVVAVAAFAAYAHTRKLRSRRKVRAGSSSKAGSGAASGSCPETAPLDKGPASNGSCRSLGDEGGGGGGPSSRGREEPGGHAAGPRFHRT
ncbi:semaphorin-4B-like [Scyliorhinus torazame]|uniref:semaphorin-4B-like n=1 Tax=Scyliorhinus torazame TaxID=75743 RepID=UPI003B5C25EC